MPLSLADLTALKLNHPIRQRIALRLLDDDAEASPGEMAREFDESLPLVSYHVRIMVGDGSLELVRTTPRRGAIQHHYRLAANVRAALRRLTATAEAAVELDGLKVTVTVTRTDEGPVLSLRGENCTLARDASGSYFLLKAKPAGKDA